MKLTESEKNRIRGLHKDFSAIQEQSQLLNEEKGSPIKVSESQLKNIIRRTVNESQLLTEEDKCEIFEGGGDDCESGTCLPDPDSGFDNCCMKIVNNVNQGCIDSYVQNDDWVEMWSDDWDKSVYSDPECDCPNGVGRQKRCGGNGCFETGPPGPLGRTTGPMGGRGPFTDRVR